MVLAEFYPNEPIGSEIFRTLFFMMLVSIFWVSTKSVSGLSVSKILECCNPQLPSLFGEIGFEKVVLFCHIIATSRCFIEIKSKLPIACQTKSYKIEWRNFLGILYFQGRSFCLKIFLNELIISSRMSETPFSILLNNLLSSSQTGSWGFVLKISRIL